ncbi:MAG: glycosyltransferase family 9 protein [Ignavibacteriaceae bacterium]
MKLLVIALSGIGDALMFTPALSLLKENIKEIEIDALVMYKGVKDIYERTNYFNEIHYFDFLNEPKVKGFKFVLGFRHKYSHSINVYPSNRKEYNLIQFLIGAKNRGGVKYLRSDLTELGFLNTVRIQEDDSAHNVQKNLLLVKKLFNIESNSEHSLLFNLSEGDLNYANDFLSSNSISQKDLVIGFHPGCSTLKNHINRRWEPEKFSELAKLLTDNASAKVLIFGGPDESELKETVKRLAAREQVISVNTENLAQTAAIIKKCNIFITNDSSLMHVAASQGVKTYAIIGPTNRNYIHPWKTEYKIISRDLSCSPCFLYSPEPLNCKRNDVKYKCIRELTPEMVCSELQLKNN